MPDKNSDNTLRLGTRGSLLAQTQSRLVAAALQERHPGLTVDLVVIKTTGDRITDRPLHEFGGKGLFTKELEQALLAAEVDFAVHSYKDVPVTMPLVDVSGLVVASVPPREDPRDVLISPHARRIEDLPRAARVGTTSLRRRSQLLAARPDLVVEPTRGNIDTRLRKLREGQYDAILLAAAGLRRAALFDPALMTFIEPDALLPAPGQGALALQCRRDDARTRDRLEALHDEITAVCVDAERALVGALRGDCHSPIAALAAVDPDTSRLRLRAAVGAREGRPPVIRAEATAEAPEAAGAVGDVLESLKRQGAESLLHETA